MFANLPGRPRMPRNCLCLGCMFGLLLFIMPASVYNTRTTTIHLTE
jgi:hypothetical protein